MTRLALGIAACLLIPSLLCGRSPRSYRKRVDRILEAKPALQQAHWGILVKELDSGRTILTTNAGQLFIPASNTKLFSSAHALSRLGPDHVFHTRVFASAPPDSDGVVHGDLLLVGEGDPNLSGRILPYREQEGTGPNPLVTIESLADQIVAGGVRHVTGSVIGDDTYFTWEPFPPGWAWDDAAESYGAAISALAVNDSSFKLTLAAGSDPGDPVELTIDPPVNDLVIHNLVQTVNGETAISYRRMPLASELTVWGWIQAGSKHTEQLASSDPAYFAASAFRQALRTRGVRVDGDADVRHRLPGESATNNEATQLASRDSAPLAQILQVIDKASQNLHAEIVQREVAKVRRGSGSRADSIAELRDFLTSIGIADTDYEFADGSGLSRLDLISPSAAVQLLTAMYRSPEQAAWLELLPTGGVDGTLSDRFSDDPRGAWVRAKTGTLRHVSALSGYVLPPSGNRYVFSILVNGYDCPAEEIRSAIDKIVLALLNGKH